MEISQAGVDLIKQFEGFRANSYQDIVGVWTIGYGTTRIDGSPVRSGMTCTVEQAEGYLSDDVNSFLNQITGSFNPLIQLNSNQVDAIACFVYNVGVGAFRKSTLLKKLNAGDFDAAALEFLKWDKAGGKAVAGLTRRRNAEKVLFETPV